MIILRSTSIPFFFNLRYDCLQSSPCSVSLKMIISLNSNSRIELLIFMPQLIIVLPGIQLAVSFRKLSSMYELIEIMPSNYVSASNSSSMVITSRSFQLFLTSNLQYKSKKSINLLGIIFRLYLKLVHIAVRKIANSVFSVTLLVNCKQAQINVTLIFTFSYFPVLIYRLHFATEFSTAQN